MKREVEIQNTEVSSGTAQTLVALQEEKMPDAHGDAMLAFVTREINTGRAEELLTPRRTGSIGEQKIDGSSRVSDLSVSAKPELDRASAHRAEERQGSASEITETNEAPKPSMIPIALSAMAAGTLGMAANASIDLGITRASHFFIPGAAIMGLMAFSSIFMTGKRDLAFFAGIAGAMATGHPLVAVGLCFTHIFAFKRDENTVPLIESTFKRVTKWGTKLGIFKEPASSNQ